MSFFSLLDLPVEIVEMIVTHNCLSLSDICSVAATCTAVNSIVSKSWRNIALNRFYKVLNFLVGTLGYG